MNNANEQFMQLMFEIGMNYGKKLNEDERKFFAMQAKRFGFNDFNVSVRKHMDDPSKGTYLPKIADIIRNLPNQLAIEKPSLEPNSCVGLSWCNNTAALVKQYGGKCHG